MPDAISDASRVTGQPLRLRPDKIGSVCMPFNLSPYVSVDPRPVAAEGAAVVCRVLTARREYGALELRSGRSAILVPGDIVVGVLGARAALRGFCGSVPKTLALGDTLGLLNQGGVMGESEGRTVQLGSPIQLEVLGTPLREGRPLRLSDYALPERPLPERLPPVLAIAGTCMSAGKTTAAAVIVHHLRTLGKVVHAGKATGVACIKDLLLYSDNGASQTLTFLDCGWPSTCDGAPTPRILRTLLAHLSAEAPDVIVVELGDGLLGAYGVDELFADSELVGCLSGVVLAANDIIGGWAAAERVTQAGANVCVITGPATDNRAGVDKLEALGYPAANIFRDAERVCRLSTEPLLAGR